MKAVIRSLIQRLLHRAGYRLIRLPRQAVVGRADPLKGGKVHIGPPACRPDGYLQVFPEYRDGVDVICEPWELAGRVGELTALSAVHVLECLGKERVRPTMDVWFDALAVGGVISIEVLDVADFMERWMEVSGSDLKLLDLENAFLGVVNEQLIPASIHGGGVRGVFDANRLENLLLMAGFSDVRTRPGARGRVRMEAIKATRKGERQVAPGLELVRADHRARYEFACQKIVAGARVLDVACGVGYGSWMVACRTQALEVLGIDIDPGALSYARAHYAHARVQYQQGDITQLELPEQSIDVAISLETIEHIAEPERFLRCLARALRPGGILLCSTPNEEVFPLRTAANPYHHRHYTPSEFEGLLGRGGFDVTERHSQMDRDPGNLVPGWNGLFNLAVCRVRSGSTSE